MKTSRAMPTQPFADPTPPRRETRDTGERLRAAREASGLTLETIARRTRITLRVLEAIEATDIAHLPAPIYTRGFVTSYAREVGLDPAATAAAYLAALEEARVASAPASRGAEGPSISMRVHRPLALIVVLVSLAAAGWLLRRDVEPPAGDHVVHAADVGERAAAADVEAAPADRDTLPSSADAAPAAAEPAATPVGAGRFRIGLETHGPCWVVVSVDGTTALARLLSPGENHTFDVATFVTLRVGDPGALRYTVDGREGRPLGRPGQPVTVRITRETLSDFLP
jgi:cytoskeleton protein RodZ